MQARIGKMSYEVICDCGFKMVLPAILGIMDLKCKCGKRYTAEAIERKAAISHQEQAAEAMERR